MPAHGENWKLEINHMKQVEIILSSNRGPLNTIIFFLPRAVLLTRLAARKGHMKVRLVITSSQEQLRGEMFSSGARVCGEVCVLREASIHVCLSIQTLL